MNEIPEDYAVHEAVQVELEEALCEQGAPNDGTQPWVPSDEDEAEVERYLNALRHYREDVANADRLKALALADLEERDARFRKDAEGAVRYLEARLKQFSEAVGRKTRKSPSGTIAWRKGSHSVVIEDEEGFCNGADPRFLNKTITVNRKAIADHIRAGQDIPTGVEWERGDPSFSIKVPK